MRDALPESIDPRRLAEVGRGLSGSLSLARMPRLAELLDRADAAGQDFAAFALEFGRDASGRDRVRGRVTATLRLRCQRCNGLLELPVSSGFTLAVVQGLDEAAQLPAEYEPLLPDEAEIDPAALVEDELLLAVPPVPRHVVGACEPPTYSGSADDGADGRSPTHENPFAVLEVLKRDP